MLSSNSISVECILCHFQGHKSQYGVIMDLCDIWTNIAETMHTMTNVFMKYIYEFIYDLQSKS